MPLLSQHDLVFSKVDCEGPSEFFGLETEHLAVFGDFKQAVDKFLAIEIGCALELFYQLQHMMSVHDLLFANGLQRVELSLFLRNVFVRHQLFVLDGSLVSVALVLECFQLVEHHLHFISEALVVQLQLDCFILFLALLFCMLFARLLIHVTQQRGLADFFVDLSHVCLDRDQPVILG